MKLNRYALIVVALFDVWSAASASPWAEVGDAQTRSDVEIAAASGLIDGVTMQWPLPWTGVLGQLQDDTTTDELPDYVREAAERLLVKGRSDVHVRHPRAELSVDFTNEPATVRDFDALGRSDVQGQLSFEYLSSDTAVRLAVGSQKENAADKQSLVFDSSYIARRIDGVVVYAGYVPHWWGPGWITALSLSNNARPIPQVGFSRVQTRQSEFWALKWLGPWQFETFVGILDGPRIARNTLYVAMRFEFNPFPGLDIGIARHTMMCGTGHPCRPLTEYVTFSNDPIHTNQTNEEATIDIKYSGTFYSRVFSVYAQFMNEDTSPILHSGTSRVYGGSVWLPFEGLTGRLTLEYANSIATNDIWGNGVFHGFAYNNYSYLDGMRYRGRTLGFSLDSDSVLYSMQASVTDSSSRSYTLSYYRALVSNPLNTWGNIVTTAPVRFNALELRTGLPFKWGEYRARIDVAARWQDDQPRPRSGSQTAFEVALRCAI